MHSSSCHPLGLPQCCSIWRASLSPIGREDLIWLWRPDRMGYPCKPLAFLTQEPAVAVTKTEVVSARVPPDVKAALAAAAESERRSVASMLEVMVLSYCR